MNPILMFDFLAGSRFLGISTPDSDYDFVYISLDPAARLFPTKPLTRVTEDEDSDIIWTELGEVLTQLFVKPDLKMIELFSVPRKLDRFQKEYNMIHFLVKGHDYSEMYQKEVSRRYNKTFYREKNPTAKNYNKEQAYDSKYAAHLFRVVSASYSYHGNRKVQTDFSSQMQTLAEIRAGAVSKEDVMYSVDNIISCIASSKPFTSPVEVSTLYLHILQNVTGGNFDR